MTTKTDFSFSDYQDELEEIISNLQDGTLSIDESIDKFKRAQIIIEELEKYLKKSQNIIKKIN